VLTDFGGHLVAAALDTIIDEFADETVCSWLAS
jgi:hypothetical protein